VSSAVYREKFISKEIAFASSFFKEHIVIGRRSRALRWWPGTGGWCEASTVARTMSGEGDTTGGYKDD